MYTCKWCGEEITPIFDACGRPIWYSSNGLDSCTDSQHYHEISL